MPAQQELQPNQVCLLHSTPCLTIDRQCWLPHKTGLLPELCYSSTCSSPQYNCEVAVLHITAMVYINVHTHVHVCIQPAVTKDAFVQPAALYATVRLSLPNITAQRQLIVSFSNVSNSGTRQPVSCLHDISRPCVLTLFCHFSQCGDAAWTRVWLMGVTFTYSAE